MGKRGPAKTPTETLKLRGSWRADVRKNEPQPEKGRPRCPKWLRPMAKRYWKRLVPQLDEMGILTLIDGNALARYCQVMAKWREAEEFLASHGDLYPVKDEAGNVVRFKQYPQVSTAMKLADQALRLEQQFGLTPSARAGLDAPIKPKDTDGKSRFFPSAG